MTVLLLCNVGTRDVKVEAPDDLPAELRHPKTGELIPRSAGAYLARKEIFEQFKDRIALPMVEKALSYVQTHHAPRAEDRSALTIVLFATDQPETTPAHYRANDTVGFAQVINDILIQRHNLTRKQVRVLINRHNPADYDLMYDYYRTELPKLVQTNTSDTLIYMLVAGGTPQMNAMLLLIGSDIFGLAGRPLYVSLDSNRAVALDTVVQLSKQMMRRNLEQLLRRAYAYSPALQIVERETGEQLMFDSSQQRLLVILLRYADARRNLNLEVSSQLLNQAFQVARSLRPEIHKWQDEVDDVSDRSKLRETIFLAQIAQETDDWADFLARLFRFAEGCMQLMAEELEVKWNNKDRRNYQERWWNDHRQVLHELGLASAVSPENPKSEDNARYVERNGLRKIIERLAPSRGKDAYMLALELLKAIEKPLSLRNRIVHDFAPLTRAEVEDKAGCSAPEIIEKMRAIYLHIFGVEVREEHPFLQVNHLCLRVLSGEV